MRTLPLALALVTAACLVPAGAARAAAPASRSTVALTTTFATSGASGCQVSTGGESPDPAVLDDAGDVSRSLTTHADASTTAGTDLTHQSGSVRTSLAQRVVHGGLAALALRTEVAVTNQPDSVPSTCAGKAAASSTETVDFVVPTDGFLTLTLTTSPGVVTQEVLLSNDTSILNDQSLGTEQTLTRRVFLPQGTGELVFLSTGQLAAPRTTSDPTSWHGTVALHAAFAPAGSAVGAAVGAGSSYLTYPGAVDCGEGTLVLRPRTRLADASVARLYVNGRLARTLKNPTTASLISLRIPARPDTLVEARIRVGTHVHRVLRRYLACA